MNTREARTVREGAIGCHSCHSGLKRVSKTTDGSMNGASSSGMEWFSERRETPALLLAMFIRLM